MEKNKKKIAYILTQDPRDKRSWSGICYSCLQQLEKHFDVETFVFQPTWLEHKIIMVEKVVARLRGQRVQYPFFTWYAKRVGTRVNQALQGKNYDAIFMIGSVVGAYIKTDTPIVYYTDANYHQMVDYYWKNTTARNIREGNDIQKRSLKNNTVNLFASDWAKQDAVDFYGIPEEKCVVGHFGANVDTANFHKAEPEKGIVNLLFVGVEWQRKGGDVAVECVRQLNKLSKDRKYILHLVGIKPPYEIKDDYIKVYGFLNRNIPEQQDLMIHLREIADFFVLPTRAECAGIVFCESSAYGIPSITYDTGGIGSYIVNGENGYRLPMTANGKDFADKILDILSDGNKLAYMKQKAVEMYNDHMNWDALGEQIEKIVNGVKK